MFSYKRVLIKILNPLLFILATVLIFEEWLWVKLISLTRVLSRLPILKSIEHSISKLPAYPSLFLLAIPFLLLFPCKLLVLYLVAQRQFFLAFVTFLVEKIIGTAVVAHLFSLTRHNILKISWFNYLFSKLVGLIAISKNWIKTSSVYKVTHAATERIRNYRLRTGFVKRKVRKFRNQKQ